jgi:hypothetical protein
MNIVNLIKSNNKQGYNKYSVYLYILYFIIIIIIHPKKNIVYTDTRFSSSLFSALSILFFFFFFFFFLKSSGVSVTNAFCFSAKHRWRLRPHVPNGSKPTSLTNLFHCFIISPPSLFSSSTIDRYIHNTHVKLPPMFHTLFLPSKPTVTTPILDTTLFLFCLKNLANSLSLSLSLFCGFVSLSMRLHGSSKLR